jgi:integration host factor subunit beta
VLPFGQLGVDDPENAQNQGQVRLQHTPWQTGVGGKGVDIPQLAVPRLLELHEAGGPGTREDAMTKSELIDAIAARGDLTKARAELVVNCLFDAMTEALQRGEGIEIRGFGSFTVRPYKPYSGRNPRTGQPVPVPAKRLPFFKVGKELKEIVNASRHLAITGGDDDSDD